MSTNELWDYIEQLALENPVIDIDATLALRPASNSLQDKFDWSGRSGNGAGSEERGDYANAYWDSSRPEAVNLSDYLLFQLLSYRLEERGLSAARYIANNLNDDGFFTENPESAAKRLGIPLVEFFETLELMQGLDPPGICAYDLQHCLSVQINRLGGNPLADRIISEHLDLLAKCEPHIIARRVKQPLEQVCACCDLIRSLDPRPGARFSKTVETSYILPDVSIIRNGDGFKAVPTDDSPPRIMISAYYKSLYKNSGSTEVDSYIEEKLQQVQRIQSSIEQKQNTILSVANSIASFQREFFCFGPRRLAPLKMSDISKALGIHESTVSRTANSKYLQCSWGTFPMNYFFPRSIKTDEGACITNDSVKRKLVEIVRSEDKSSPLSDRILADILHDSGFPVSRRTVTKYRVSIGIPAASGRKARGTRI